MPFAAGQNREQSLHWVRRSRDPTLRSAAAMAIDVAYAANPSGATTCARESRAQQSPPDRSCEFPTMRGLVRKEGMKPPLGIEPRTFSLQD